MGLGEVGGDGVVFLRETLAADAEREWSESASLAPVFRSGAVRNVFFPSAASLQECLYKAMKSSASDNLKPAF